MRPLLLEIPAKPAFYILLVAGAILTLALAIRAVREKKELKSLGPTLLIGALIAARVGSGSWRFWEGGALDRVWDPVPIFSYGVMLGCSLIVGWYLALWLGEKDHLSKQGVAGIYVWTAVTAVIGARLLYVATNLETYKHPLDILKVHEGGLVAYGGFLGGFAASWYYCIKNKWGMLQWADVAVIPVALGLSITRIGCLLYGCDFGARSTVAWAITFPGKTALNKMRGSPAFQHHLAVYGLDPTADRSFPVHPTQLYEVLLGIGIVAVLFLIRRKRRFSGQMFVAFVVMYGVARALIEILRDDAERGGIGSFSTSQLIGIGSSLMALVLYLVLWLRYKQSPAKYGLVHAGGGDLAPPASAEPEETPSPAPAKSKRRRNG